MHKKAPPFAKPAVVPGGPFLFVAPMLTTMVGTVVRRPLVGDGGRPRLGPILGKRCLAPKLYSFTFHPLFVAFALLVVTALGR